jgi:general stress protein 26
MDSINKQQQEDTQKPLQGQEAVKKIRELAETAKTCFFCTGLRNGSAFGTRPMSVQKIDDQGSLWFLSANDSHKDQDIESDPSVQLFFQGSAHSDFLTIYGEATVSQDKAKIDELWEPLMKTWFTGGKDDPRISVIEVKPSESYYWDNKHGNAVAFIKMLTGAVIGKTLDDSVEGKLKV